MITNYNLNAQKPLTSIVVNSGILNWGDLIIYTKKLPYGRNSDRKDFSLIISEKKGSCSSKHAFLKKVADENELPNINLILGIYKMTEKNTPKIGTILSENNLDFIPEAHCYLEINHEKIDITSENSSFKTLEKDILQEIKITPEQVVEFKVNYHKEFLKKWIVNNNISYSFEELWIIREQCILNLSC